MHTDQPEEGIGDAVGPVSKRFAEFRPLVRARGQLQMPSGVLAASPAAQGDLRGRQAQVLGVEVLGLHLVLHGLLHPVNAGQVLKRRKEYRFLDIKLPFDLNDACRGHTGILRPEPLHDARCSLPGSAQQIDEPIPLVHTF